MPHFVLEDLSIFDYSEGPKSDTMLDGADMWIFGRVINSREVYIKITLGAVGLSVICI